MKYCIIMELTALVDAENVDDAKTKVDDDLEQMAGMTVLDVDIRDVSQPSCIGMWI